VIVQFHARLLGYVGSQRADLLCTTKYDIKPALKCITHTSPLIFFYILMSRQAWRLCSEALAVMLGGTASSADLGGGDRRLDGVARQFTGDDHSADR